MPKAVLCRKLGTPDDLVLEEVAPAPLGPGQLRVAVHAAGINFPDLLMVAGLYQHKPTLPFIPGLEAAGVVTEIAAGGAGAFAMGDRVMVQLRQGGYAEEVVVAPEQAMPLPKGFSFAECEGESTLFEVIKGDPRLVERCDLSARALTRPAR
jgi:NADPH2:quinone reductase